MVTYGLGIYQERLGLCIDELHDAIRRYADNGGVLFCRENSGVERGATFEVQATAVAGIPVMRPGLPVILGWIDQHRIPPKKSIRAAASVPAGHLVVREALVDPESRTYTGVVKIHTVLHDYDL